MRPIDDLGIKLHQRKECNKNNIPSADHPTLVVVELSGHITEEIAEWLASLIRAPQYNGGAGLLAKTWMNKKNKTWALHVTGEPYELVKGAGLIGLKKKCLDGILRELSMDYLPLFVDLGDMDKLLTKSDKQRIILHQLELMQLKNKVILRIPILDKQPNYDEPIMPQLFDHKVIAAVYPLHDDKELEYLGQEWYLHLYQKQPTDHIRSYFGDTIAMYFSFLEYYTLSLVAPALIGLFTEMFFDSSNFDLIIFFSLFNLIWVMIVHQAWKWQSAKLVHTWTNTELFEENRMVKYEVRGTFSPNLQLYMISVPVVMLCLVCAVLGMFSYFILEVFFNEYHQTHQTTFTWYLKLVPCVLYALFVSIASRQYRRLAKVLTDWENHLLQSEYDKHLITKLVLFEFVNCFLSLFYIAFYLKNIELLRKSLAILLIEYQVIQQCQETLVPFFIFIFHSQSIKKQHNKQKESDKSIKSNYQVEDDEFFQTESAKMPYENAIDDYLELYIQFGFVYLFSAVYPTAAFWALLNNIIEIKSDAFKLCRVCQRSFAQPSAGIGVWLSVFEAMIVLAVMTNCALVAYSPYFKELLPGHEEADIFILLVIVEQVILLVKVIIMFIVPDKPDWIKRNEQQLEQQSKMALRKQNCLDACKMLKERESCDDQNKKRTAMKKDV